MNLPTDDWLCKKFNGLNLTLLEGYPSKSSEAGGLQCDHCPGVLVQCVGSFERFLQPDCEIFRSVNYSTSVQTHFQRNPEEVVENCERIQFHV